MRPPILACGALLLVGACGSQPPASVDSVGSAGPTRSAASITAQPVVVPAEMTGTQPAGDWPKPSELERQALSVAVYRSGAPSECGIAAPKAEGSGATATIHFGCVREQGSDAPAVPARIVRIASGDEPMKVAVRALLGGPTAAESRAGYISSFSPASGKIPFRVARLGNGLAALDFDRAILDVNAPRPDPTQNPRRLFVTQMDAHQIVATLGQFPGVQRVAILAGGQPLCRARGGC